MDIKNSAAIDVADYMSTKKQAVDTALLRVTESLQPSIIGIESYRDEMYHAIIGGGKRIRPILAIAAFESCGGVGDSILMPACIPELIHAGSLMLDDLPCMDNATTRRGKPTAHALFGESSTILISAALWIGAFEVLSTLNSVHSQALTKKMSKIMGGKGLIQGQLLDLAAFNSSQNIEDLEECYKLKTGLLFSLCTSIGATMTGASDTTITAFEKYGEEIGIAFQIKDDIIDASNTSDQTGKDSGLDIKNNKPNYVSLLGLDGAISAIETKKMSAISYLNEAEVNTELLTQLTNHILNI